MLSVQQVLVKLMTLDGVLDVLELLRACVHLLRLIHHGAGELHRSRVVISDNLSSPWMLLVALACNRCIHILRTWLRRLIHVCRRLSRDVRCIMRDRRRLFGVCRRLLGLCGRMHLLLLLHLLVLYDLILIRHLSF